MPTTFTVAIDWDHDGSWNDETAHTRRARIKSGFDAVGYSSAGDANVARMGRCTLTMDNTSLRFSPGNTAGPLYGKLLPRREVRVQASDGINTWTLFRGFIERIQPDTGTFGDGACVIDCVDALALLARQRIGMVYAATKPVDEAISAVVSAAYTPPATSYSDNGDSLSHYGRAWQAERTSTLEALSQICDAVYGRFYVARDGTATYITRDDRLDASGAAAMQIGVSDVYWQRVRDVQPGNLLGLWRLNEASGTEAADSSGNDYDGTYVGATLAGLTGPDGSDAPTFDGINDKVDLSSSGVIAGLDSAEGTALIWFRVADSSVWSDDANRLAFSIYTSGTNCVYIGKDNINRFYMRYRAGGVVNQYADASYDAITWACAAMTWSVSADEVKFYVNGEQVGSTLTGLGTWAGAITDVNIGSVATNQYWAGSLALCALWDEALSDAQILSLGSV